MEDAGEENRGMRWQEYGREGVADMSEGNVSLLKDKTLGLSQRGLGDEGG